MPVYKPTAGSIWNSFRNSGKRHLFLTGDRGSGKTTLLSKLFPEELPGITTWAEPEKCVYMKENCTDTVIEIARYNAFLSGDRKMALCSEGFVSFGVPVLERCRTGKSEWVSIDEIGFLEETCEPYKNALRELLEQKRIVAVLRKQDLPFLNELRERNDVFLVDLDQPYGKSGCVIMASGMSKRFGGNKLLADFCGVPLITKIMDATDGLFEKRIVVTRHESVVSICRARDIEVIHHNLPNRNDTIRIGLETMDSVERCMFCPGDQPVLRTDTIASLLLSAENNPESIWRLGYDKTQGAPVLFPKWTFSELLDLPEGKGGSWVVKKHPDKTELLHVSDFYELMDADTPDSLEQLRQYAIKSIVRGTI